MKNMALILIVMMAIFVIGCTTRRHCTVEILHEPGMDTNSDGKISQKEFNKRMEIKAHYLIEKPDKNGDNRISIDEFIEARKKSSYLVIYEDMDEDNNRKVTENEYDSYNKKLFSILLKKYASIHKTQISTEDFLLFYNNLFAKIDMNSNGYITKKELKEHNKTAPVPKEVNPHVLAHPKISLSEPPPHLPEYDLDEDFCAEPNPPDWCQHPGYPGCNYGDIRSGGYMLIWDGTHCIPD